MNMALVITAMFPIHSEVPEFVSYKGNKSALVEADVVDAISIVEKETSRYKEYIGKAIIKFKASEDAKALGGKGEVGELLEGEIVPEELVIEEVVLEPKYDGGAFDGRDVKSIQVGDVVTVYADDGL